MYIFLVVFITSYTMVVVERELSVCFSVPSSVYTSLLLVLDKCPIDLYTENSTLVKNVYHYNATDNGESAMGTLRTIQTDCGYEMQIKSVLSNNMYKCLYKHASTNLTLILNIHEKVCSEKNVNIGDYRDKLKGYKQVIRDYVFCRNSGIRIAVERHFNDYIDPDIFQMDYDCFNRYKFDCYVHIEFEFVERDENNLSSILANFVDQLSKDDVVFRLFTIISNKNLNCISDELVNINKITLQHNYGYCSINNTRLRTMKYFSLKYDGIRKNFCIFGRFFQIDGKYIEFENHWFGQIIMGHCELVHNVIFIIDIYIVSENFFKIAKKYNVSYTDALQNYHHFYNNRTTGGGGTDDNLYDQQPKTQDEYFHMKRLSNTIKFIDPIDAIHVIKLLSNIWQREPRVAEQIYLQTFLRSLKKIRTYTTRCPLKIDGILGYTQKKIFKFKKTLTIDLLLKSDEMFRSIYKKMKTNNNDIKRMIKFINIQKTLNWVEFEHKYPGKFNKFAMEHLFFSQHKSFHKNYPDWRLSVDVAKFCSELARLTGTFFVILLEFEVDAMTKELTFTRLRDDKFSANSLNVFRKILKQM